MTGPTMLAAVLTAPESLRMERVPVPEPRGDEVRVRLAGCGVCGTDLGQWTAPLRSHRPSQPDYPVQPGGPGREGWGIIDALGPDVAPPARSGRAPGQAVALLGERSFAHYDLAPARLCVPLPARLAGQPFPATAFGHAATVVRRAAIAPQQWVAVIGLGFVGAVVTRLAAAAGARVIALSRRDCALALARTLGAAATLRMDDDREAAAAVARLTGAALCPRAVVCTGRPGAVHLAAALVGGAGRIVMAHHHPDDPDPAYLPTSKQKGPVVISAHERDPAALRRGVEEAIAAIAAGQLDPAPLLTHRYPLDRLGDALAATRDRPDDFVKAVVMMEPWP